jgi:hypothetical protein
MVVPSFRAAQRHLLSEPCALVSLTDTQALVYQPFACTGASKFFFSRRLEQHYAGRAIVVGTAVDGHPVSCGKGVLEAMKRDVLFLGDVEQAKRTMSGMAKFAAGTVEAHKTTQ